MAVVVGVARADQARNECRVHVETSFDSSSSKLARWSRGLVEGRVCVVDVIGVAFKRW